MPTWPTGESFRTAVRTTLAAMIDVGCRVAWVGAEGVPFADPPVLFDPEFMSGALLAWLLDDGTFECPLDPDQPIASATDDQLAAVRRYAHGLADAPS